MTDIVDPVARPEPDEARRCRFRDYRGKLTSEHIWRADYHKITPGMKSATHNLGNMENPTRRQWRGKVFAARVRIDCGKCNHERLRRIENDALHYTAFMAANNGTAPMGADVQRRVAALAFRQFAVGQYTDPT